MCEIASASAGGSFTVGRKYVLRRVTDLSIYGVQADVRGPDAAQLRRFGRFSLPARASATGGSGWSDRYGRRFSSVVAISRPKSPWVGGTIRALAPAALLVALLAAGAAPASADVPTSGALYRDGQSGRYLVGGTWHRRADPHDRGRRLGWHRTQSLAGWQDVTVPNAANAGDTSARSYLGGVWWYRKDFETPAAPSSTTWLLRFESVNFRATVWLNGRRIGSHTGGYLPFELEARRIRHSGTNRLVVRVDSRRGPLDVPAVGRRKGGAYVGGWWNYAGILREVYLRKVDKLDFANVFAKPELDCRTCDATVRVRAIVGNFDVLPADAEVSGRIGSEQLNFTSATVPGRGFHLFSASARVARPRLWSPDNPNLYRVALKVSIGGRVVQRYTLYTGIRSLKVDPSGRMLLNYEPVKLHGASLHEDDPKLGAALGPQQIRNDVDLLRDLGTNITRAHYPLHPLTLELADRYGILVWSEVPVYQMTEALFRRAKIRRAAIGMLRDEINRDRNHPAVTVWSLGNENTSHPGPGFSRYVRSATRLAKDLDPTRLVGLSFPGYPTVGKQDLYTSLDVLGVNDYFGWYPGPQGSIGDRNGLAPYLQRLHDDYPTQALFVTEFGAEANRDGPVTEKGTYAFQQDFLTYHINVFDTKPFINGELVWILKDFRVKPGYNGGDPIPAPPLNQKGLVDPSGARKPAFEVVQRLFRAESKGK
jgi:beta-glucuronidase